APPSGCPTVRSFWPSRSLAGPARVVWLPRYTARARRPRLRSPRPWLDCYFVAGLTLGLAFCWPVAARVVLAVVVSPLSDAARFTWIPVTRVDVRVGAGVRGCWSWALTLASLVAACRASGAATRRTCLITTR